MSKYINYILAAVVTIMLAIVFYPSDQESSRPIQKEITLNEPIKQEENTLEVTYEEPIKNQEVKKVKPKKEEIILKVEAIKPIEINDEKKSIKNIRISDLADIYNLQLKEETTILYKSSDKNNRYDISLKSSQKITSVLPGGRYILLNGTLEEDGKKSNFSLSFNEHYKDYTQYSYIEVINKDTNITATCDGSFLSGITPEYKYSLRCDLSADMLSCYIEGEEQMLNILNLIDKNMDIKLDKSQINKLNQRK